MLRCYYGYSNMRDINGEIMRQITDALYEQIVE